VDGPHPHRSGISVYTLRWWHKSAENGASHGGPHSSGISRGVVQPIGLLCLICTFLYVIPRTSVLGAVLLTGYLGGATATQVRLQDPWFIFPVLIGVMAWVGPFLMDERLRALIPLRSPKAAS
jgi:DoxX-like family